MTKVSVTLAKTRHQPAVEATAAAMKTRRSLCVNVAALPKRPATRIRRYQTYRPMYHPHAV